MRNWNFIVEIYLAFTMVFFGITAILAQREIKARSDFQMILLGGTLNVYRYYRHLRNNHEELTTRFRLFLLAHLNFVLCVIVFVISAFFY
jgi:hypothetical protein